MKKKKTCVIQVGKVFDFFFSLGLNLYTFVIINFMLEQEVWIRQALLMCYCGILFKIIYYKNSSQLVSMQFVSDFFKGYGRVYNVCMSEG